MTANIQSLLRRTSLPLKFLRNVEVKDIAREATALCYLENVPALRSKFRVRTDQRKLGPEDNLHESAPVVERYAVSMVAAGSVHQPAGGGFMLSRAASPVKGVGAQLKTRS
jgi:hypothetical protein